MLKSIATTVWSWLARAWRYWMNDIRNRKSFAGKAASIGIGLLAICCVCSVPIGMINGPRNARNNTTLASASTTVSATSVASASGNTKATAPAVATAVQPTNAPVYTPTPALTATPEPTQTALPTATPLPSVGQPILVGRLGWQVTKAVSLGNHIKSPNRFVADLVTSGQFIDVRYYVENMSKDPIYHTGSLNLVDEQGRRFAPATVLDMFIDEPCNTAASLNPGTNTTCEAIYEVPADVRGLKLEVVGKDGILEDTKVLVDLGLAK